MPRLAPVMTLAFALLSAAPGAVRASGEPGADRVHAVVERVLRAYGGRGALARVRAYRMEGTVFSGMRHDDAPTVRVFARPDRFKALVDYDDGPEARIADGRQVWRNHPGGPLEPADGAMRAAVLLQALRAGLPWILAERESLLRIDADSAPPPGVLGDDDAKKAYIALTWRVAEGLVFRVWISPDGVVAVSQGLLERGGMSTHFETVYSDLREIQGVQFAFHEDNWASGMRIGYTDLDRVILNPTLRRDEFRPPAGTGRDKGGD